MILKIGTFDGVSEITRWYHKSEWIGYEPLAHEVSECSDALCVVDSIQYNVMDFMGLEGLYKFLGGGGAAARDSFDRDVAAIVDFFSDVEVLDAIIWMF